MALNLGSSADSALYLGSTEVTKVYLGSSVVLEPAGGYPATPYFHFQRNTGITLDTAPDPDLVSQWDDQSGNARHASQATASLRPGLDAGGGIDFSTGGDYLEASGLVGISGAMGDSALNGGRPVTIGGVVNRSPETGNRCVFAFGASISAGPKFRLFTTGAAKNLRFQVQLASGSGTTLQYGGANLSDGERFCFVVTFGVGGAMSLRVNGSEIGTATHTWTGSQSWDHFALGMWVRDGAAVHPYPETLYELIGYDSVLTGDDLSALESELAARSVF